MKETQAGLGIFSSSIYIEDCKTRSWDIMQICISQISMITVY